MNVNDCLSVEATSNIANEATCEVGLDIVMKNINQTHHLLSIEMSIGSLYVFCQKFSLSGDKIFCEFNTMTRVSSDFIVFTRQLSTMRKNFRNMHQTSHRTIP